MTSMLTVLQRKGKKNCEFNGKIGNTFAKDDFSSAEMVMMKTKWILCQSNQEKL